MKLKFYVFIIVMSWSTAMTKSQTVRLLIGSAGNTTTDGIYVYDFNTVTGETVLKSLQKVNRPSYLAAGTGNNHIYSITEGENISTFAYEKLTGELTYLDKESSGGRGPIHLSVDKKGEYAFVANYDGGSLTVLPIGRDGTLQTPSQMFVSEGRSVNPVRQTKPYVHSAVLSPDNRFLFSSDLGTDRINTYKLKNTKALMPLEAQTDAVINMEPGSGPRFFTFHPSLSTAYVVEELSGNITAFHYKTGKLEALQRISMLSPDFRGKCGAADIHVSPDGKFVYATNRGDANELVGFSVNKADGRLAFATRHSSAIKRPRYFAIDPSGNFLLLTHQGSDDITVLKRDRVSGQLSKSHTIKVSSPVCLLFTN